MNKNNFNGFASEEQYEAVYEKVKWIVFFNQKYPYDTIGIYGGEDCIEVVIDNFDLMLYSDSGCEIETEKRLIPLDIVDIAAELANSMRDGDFDFVFNHNEMEDQYYEKIYCYY